MKKTLVPIAVLALSLMTAPVAFAQEEPADCGAATVALQTAKTEHDKAVADDDKLAKAEQRRDARDDAKDDRDAKFKKVDGFVIGVSDLDSAKAIRQEIRDRLAPGGDLGGESRAVLERKERVLNDYIRAENDLVEAQRKVDRNQSVADARRDADRTDADALQKALDAAQDDVNRLCGGTTTPTPTPTPEPENDVDCDEVSASEAQRILDEDRNDPNNLDQDKDGIACEVDEILPDPDDDNPVTINNNVAVPSGGVATGGGPAWAFQ